MTSCSPIIRDYNSPFTEFKQILKVEVYVYFEAYMYTFDPIQPFYPGEKKTLQRNHQKPQITMTFMPMNVCKHLTTTIHQKLVYKPLQHHVCFQFILADQNSKLDRNKLGTNHEPTYQ